MHRILVVEDEKKMSGFIQQGLLEQGYLVDVADHPKQAQELVENVSYDLLILDIMLPETDGLELSRRFRAKGYSGLVLMLTALNTTRDKVAGLDAGADDYLTKPFDFNELLARVRALLRRRGEATTTLVNGDLVMDLIKRTVVREGHIVDLTSKEFALMELFLRNVDKVLDRNAIAKQVWGTEFDPDSNVIDVYVNHLRKKMDNPFPRKLLRTIVGHGYILSKNH
ncbi:MAG: response regulator transcription factor [Bacteriovoracaceae bacterium]|nr:response regulator transcription factor [Bacteriovoracaceae bacterium]